MAYTAGEDGIYRIPLIDFGERLRDNFGLTIREHEHFDPVDDVHSPNSHHYHGNAIDIQDWRDDVIDGVSWQDRTRNLEGALAGAGVEVFGPNSGVEGHDTHLHLAGHDGFIHLNADQYDYFFGGNSGGRAATFQLSPGTPVTPPASGGSNGSADTDDDGDTDDWRATAKERAQKYRSMSKDELNAEYDSVRDTADGADLGMEMHKAYFRKP